MQAPKEPSLVPAASRGCARLEARAPLRAPPTRPAAVCDVSAKALRLAQAWPSQQEAPRPGAVLAASRCAAAAVAGMSPPAPRPQRRLRVPAAWSRTAAASPSRRPRLPRKALHPTCGRRRARPRSRMARHSPAVASGSKSSGRRSCRRHARLAGTSSSATPIRPPQAQAYRPSQVRSPWPARAPAAPSGRRCARLRS